MADDVDRANDKAQQDLELGIAAARMGGATLPPMGECYNCQEPLADELKFRDENCRDDYQLRNRRQ